jgi:Protein of unknown function (DUF1264)
VADSFVHVRGAYGKIWYTWYTDVDKQLPSGVPNLLVGFTAEGQIDPKMIARPDHRMNIDTAEKKANRVDIAVPPAGSGAAVRTHGEVFQISGPTVSQSVAAQPGENLHDNSTADKK